MLGPRADEPTTLPTRAIDLSGDTVTFTPAPRFALIRFASANVITSEALHVPSAGAGHCPPLLKVTASPAATRPISTPMAPASLARRTFSLTLHAPRSISATLPFG